MEKAVRYILIAALVLMQVLFGIPEFLRGADQYWLRAFTYSFFHANWWHLAVNALAIWTIYNYTPKRPCKPCRDLLFPFLRS